MTEETDDLIERLRKLKDWLLGGGIPPREEVTSALGEAADRLEAYKAEIEAWKALAMRAIDCVSDAEREADWNIPTFGPTISEEMQAEARTLIKQGDR